MVESLLGALCVLCDSAVQCAWLGEEDSNLRDEIQSLGSYH